MELSEYKEFLLTNTEIYSKKVTENLVEMMLDRNIMSATDPIFEKYAKDYKYIVNNAINNIGIKAINVLEEWEFLKNYQYSVLYKAAVKSKEEILDRLYSAESIEFNIDKENVEELQHIITKPIIKLIDERIFIKFPLMKTGIKPSGDILKVKYPIVVVIYHTGKEIILEIRYDSINGVLVDDYKQFYKKNISSVKAWLTSKIGIRLDNLELYDAVVRTKDSGEVKLGGQDMRFSNGAKACLEVGSDVSYTLPLLGELKEIISENEEEFNKAITIKQVLEAWIKSKEEEADYMWICLCWPDDKNRKTYEVRARFVFDYFGEDETLIYHYSGILGTERMDNVTRTIIKNL